MQRATVILVLVAWMAILSLAGVGRADVDSGPKAGDETPVLPVFVAAGDSSGQSLDFKQFRGGKPTLYFIVPADKWSRPVARLLKQLDDRVTSKQPDAVVCFVYLTDDVPMGKDYLPRAQMSLSLGHTFWTVYEGHRSGPGEWGINTDADCTVVISGGGKVRYSQGFVSANDTLTETLLAELAKAAP